MSYRNTVTPPRWLINTADRKRALATLIGSLPDTHARRVAQVIADKLEAKVVMVMDHGPRRRNPTLVHHGLAKDADWHVLWAVNGAAAADLYTPARDLAKRVTQAISDVVGARMVLLDNLALPKYLRDHQVVLEAKPPGWRAPRPRRDPFRPSCVRLNPARKKARKGSGEADVREYLRSQFPDGYRIKGGEVHYRTHKGFTYGTDPSRWRWAYFGTLSDVVRQMPLLPDETDNPLPRWADPRSVRTVRRGGTRIRVACPEGHWHPLARSARQCDVGMRAIEKAAPASQRAAGKNPILKSGLEHVQITITKREVAAFKRRWPASGLPNKAIRFVFNRSGDLVGINLTHADQQRAYGSGALPALAADAWRVGYLKRGIIGGAGNPRGKRRWPRAVGGKGTNGSALARARRTFRKWHEFDSSRLVRMRGPSRQIPRTLVRLGEVPEIIYRSDKYTGRATTYRHVTKRPRPVLATDPDGKHLFLVGGNVRVTGDGLVN